jgi:hypothetical protein
MLMKMLNIALIPDKKAFRRFNYSKNGNTGRCVYAMGRWLSADPAMGDYLPVAPISGEVRRRNGNLPGMGGVFNYVNLHAYHYAGNNPVRYIDPTGAYDLNHENKIIYTDLTIKDLDAANTIFACYQQFGYKVIALDDEGRASLEFTDFRGMNAFMEKIDPSSGNGFVISIGLTGSLGGGGTASAGTGMMIGISSDGIKVKGYNKIGGVVMVGATVSGGLEIGINFNTGNPLDLDGFGWSMGGSVGNGVYMGGDINWGKYPGASFGFGPTIRFPIPGEGHSGPTVLFVYPKDK